LQLQQQEENHIDKIFIEELKTLYKKYEKLKHSHNFLIGKHENLEKKYIYVINVSSHINSLEKENTNLTLSLCTDDERQRADPREGSKSC
jgi:hypothetical protein